MPDQPKAKLDIKLVSGLSNNIACRVSHPDCAGL